MSINKPLNRPSRLKEALDYFVTLSKEVLVKPPSALCPNCLKEMYLDEKYKDLIAEHDLGYDPVFSEPAREMEETLNEIVLNINEAEPTCPRCKRTHVLDS